MLDSFFLMLKQPWPWYVSGPIIGLCVPLLLIAGNKSLGISSILREICAAILPGKINFLNYDWQQQRWNLVFALGLITSGFVGGILLNSNEPIHLSVETRELLIGYGIANQSGVMPSSIFNFNELLNLRGLIMIVGGGFLVGFGTRWAGGCTSGHGILGLSTFQWPSLVATITFFTFGILTSIFLLPVIIKIGN
jgi:uncharacterized membrane protein YedE/YeeE